MLVWPLDLLSSGRRHTERSANRVNEEDRLPMLVRVPDRPSFQRERLGRVTRNLTLFLKVLDVLLENKEIRLVLASQPDE